MIQKSGFKPAWWLKGGHCQTLWPPMFRRRKKLPLIRERFELPDGDFIDLDWVNRNAKPLVLILHGLSGSIQSSYAQGILHAIYQCGWGGVFLNFRGCSGEPNRLARSYHSGDTADLACVAATLRERYPDCPIVAVGFSLGGNVLLKWLGETKEQNPLTAAVAVSAPLEMFRCVERVNRGFSKIYQWAMLYDLKRILLTKFKKMESPIPLAELIKLNTFPEFDGKITAPLHGFKDAMDYYNKASSLPYLKHIQVPTLILNALDDPLLAQENLFENIEMSEHLIIELSDRGGHVGFVGGKIPLWPTYWLDQRIPEFFIEKLNQK